MHRIFINIITAIILEIHFPVILLRIYVENFHSIHVHSPSTKERSRNSCEIIGIYTKNATELLTGQIPNRPQCKLTATCTVSTGKHFYFY